MVLQWGCSGRMGNSNGDIRILMMQRKGPYLPFDTKRTPLHHKCACIAVETVNEKLHGATHFGGTYVQPRQFHADV